MHLGYVGVRDQFTGKQVCLRSPAGLDGVSDESPSALWQRYYE
jgi:hypothetical protein